MNRITKPNPNKGAAVEIYMKINTQNIKAYTLKTERGRTLIKKIEWKRVSSI